MASPSRKLMFHFSTQTVNFPFKKWKVFKGNSDMAKAVIRTGELHWMSQQHKSSEKSNRLTCLTCTRTNEKTKDHPYHPSLSAAFTFTPNCTKNFTISVWPAHTALWSAVMPSSLGKLGSSTYGAKRKTGCLKKYSFH